jgi:hypothetical protein
MHELVVQRSVCFRPCLAAKFANPNTHAVVPGVQELDSLHDLAQLVTKSKVGHIHRYACGTVSPMKHNRARVVVCMCFGAVHSATLVTGCCPASLSLTRVL